MSRRKPVDSAEKSLRKDRVLEGHVLLQCLQIHFFLIERIFQDTLDLGPVDKTALDLRVIKWLDSEHIAGGKEFFCPCVPDDKGEHTSQPVQNLCSVLAVAVKEHLCVRIGPELVSLNLQDFPQFPVIINLSVKRDDQSSVLCLHGLISALQIDDGETPKAHGYLFIHKCSGAVRPSMDDTVHHIRQDRFAIDIVSGKSADSTHNRTTSCLAVSPFSRLCGYNNRFKPDCNVHPLLWGIDSCDIFVNWPDRPFPCPLGIFRKPEKLLENPEELLEARKNSWKPGRTLGNPEEL